MFNSGVSRIGDLIDLAVAKNIVAKTGAWFSYNEERLGQGRENSKEFLEQNPKIVAEIEKKVYEAYGVEVVGAGKGDKAEKSSKEDKAERAGAVADRAEVVADKDDDKKAVKAAQPVAAATKVKKPMAASK
jgi:recombination protein RecA